MIKDDYTVSELVKAAKVSRQAYYKWLKRELTMSTPVIKCWKTPI